jgi:hypothetical protein
MMQVKPNTSLLYSFDGADGELVLSLSPQTRFMASFDNDVVKLNGHNMVLKISKKEFDKNWTEW